MSMKNNLGEINSMFNSILAIVLKKPLVLLPIAGSFLFLFNVKPATAASLFTQCPTIGASTGCKDLITINPDGSVGIASDPGQRYYDGGDDILVGVSNLSGKTVNSISINASDFFGFDGDGACNTTYGKCQSDSTGYAGPNTSFTVADQNTGIVNFTNGLAPGESRFFSGEADLISSLVGTATVTANINPGSSGGKSVPEPLTLGGSLLAGGFGWLMKRKAATQAKA